MDIPYATHKEATYENFIAECPHCGFMNIFNRASDLRTFECIGFLTVRCFDQSCKSDFNINGDLVSTAYEMLLSECYRYIEKKQYMQCILTVAQVYEIFFSHFLNVQLLYRPFSKERKRDIEKLNTLSKELYNKVKTFPYCDMKRLFIKLIIDNNFPSKLDESERIIKQISRKEFNINLDGIKNERLKSLLGKLEKTHINQIRNKVVHKYAFRPSFEDADSYHKEAKTIISGFNNYFKLRGNANWHLNQ